MKRGIFATTLILIILAALAFDFGFYETYLRRPGSKSENVPLTVEPGTGVKAIAAELKNKGAIRSRFIFETYVWISGTQARFQTGKFYVRSGQSYAKIVKQLTSPGVSEREITLLEGWGIREMAEYLKRQGIAEVEDFYRIAGTPATDYRNDRDAFRSKDFSQEFAFLAGRPDYVSLEGYLFPDTYRIPLEVTAEDIVRVMLKNFDRRINQELRAEAESRGRTLFEVITLASIIEREVRADADRALVSDILWRRLDAGMPLQVDSSVNYLTGKKTPSISFDDREIDSPYNTYKYPGLPLGPIGNPGLSSILAAIRPKTNNYWYFLAGTDGVIRYGRTLEEHGENRVLYLR